MKLIVNKSSLSGSVEIPGSKSHTIRALIIAALARGESRIRKPLVAADTLACLHACENLGAQILKQDDWIVRGVGGVPEIPGDVIDVQNSGTTLYIALATAALIDGWTVFTGDEQIRRRPAGPLIRALRDLGARVESTRGNDAAPIIVHGPMHGGSIVLDGSDTSQYLTGLLINCPLAGAETTIEVTNLVEKPYVEMTLGWMREQGIRFENDGLERFVISGGQSYHAFDKRIPADFSSATFFLCAAAITGSEIVLEGLDMNDTQGDKAVVGMLAEMGAEVEQLDGGLKITGSGLRGAEFDLNNTPDALPALAVTACFAEGETRLVNVPQARLKETDRISVMRQELSKMGANIEELPDGLVIRGSRLHPAQVHGHHDHRVIMALTLAGLCLEGETTISSAEALSVTFPTFPELMQGLGGEIKLVE